MGFVNTEDRFTEIYRQGKGRGSVKEEESVENIVQSSNEWEHESAYGTSDNDDYEN